MKHDPNFPYEMYRFLIRSIREADKDVALLLERYLNRPQYWFETLLAKMDDVLDLLDPVLCPEAWVRELAKHVGWTKELRAITNLASTADMRKLIVLAVPFWKIKGSEPGIVDALRAFTGKSVIVDDWFDYRFIVDEPHMEWITLPGGGPWVIGGGGGPFDEYVSDIFIQDSATLNHSLVEKLVEVLFRPTNERYYIIYCDFLDDFDLGLSQWAVQAGTPTTPDNSLYMLSGDALWSEAAAGWSNLLYRFDFQFTTAGTLVATFYDTRPFGGTDYYYVSINGATNTFRLIRFTSGLGHVVLGAYMHAVPLSTARWGIMVRAQDIVGGTDLEVYLDGDLKIHAADVAVAMGAGGIDYTLSGGGRCSVYRPHVIELPGTITKVPSWL
jgi:hypothetical protein